MRRAKHLWLTKEHVGGHAPQGQQTPQWLTPLPLGGLRPKLWTPQRDELTAKLHRPGRTTGPRSYSTDFRAHIMADQKPDEAQPPQSRVVVYCGGPSDPAAPLLPEAAKLTSRLA